MSIILEGEIGSTCVVGFLAAVVRVQPRCLRLRERARPRRCSLSLQDVFARMHSKCSWRNSCLRDSRALSLGGKIAQSFNNHIVSIPSHV